MGKRQIRIGPDKFEMYLPEVTGNKATFVRADGSVLFGLLQLVWKDFLQIKDQSGKTHLINPSELFEIIVDFEAPY